MLFLINFFFILAGGLFLQRLLNLLFIIDLFTTLGLGVGVVVGPTHRQNIVPVQVPVLQGLLGHLGHAAMAVADEGHAFAQNQVQILN